MELKTLLLNVRGLNKTKNDGSCLDGYINKTQMLFSFMKHTRPPKLLSSGQLNGVAKLLKVTVLITALV